MALHTLVVVTVVLGTPVRPVSCLPLLHHPTLRLHLRGKTEVRDITILSRLATIYITNKVILMHIQVKDITLGHQVRCTIRDTLARDIQAKDTPQVMVTQVKATTKANLIKATIQVRDTTRVILLKATIQVKLSTKVTQVRDTAMVILVAITQASSMPRVMVVVRIFPCPHLPAQKS